MQKYVLVAGAVALTAFAATAFAQGATKSPKQRSAASMECSQQADAKGLHGKKRAHFRSKCIRGMAKAGKGKTDRPMGYR